jgi:ribonuclease III
MSLRQRLRRLWRRRATNVGNPAALQGIRDFEDHIGYGFSQADLAARALTHRSYLNSNGSELCDSNERLEFLGDSVLELVVNEYLFHRYPDQQEGELTKMKSLLVSRGVLADQAKRLNLGRFLFMSDAERDSGGGFRSSILADGFEAVIGALYLDGGLCRARAFIEEHLLVDVDYILGSRTHVNYKSVLQENIQERMKTYPRYKIVSETGPDHRKVFTVEVTVKGEQLGLGKGTNKKRAEQAAAQNALERVGLL